MDTILLSDGTRGIYTQLQTIKTLKRMQKEGVLEVYSVNIKLDGEFMSTFSEDVDSEFYAMDSQILEHLRFKLNDQFFRLEWFEGDIFLILDKE